jgi:hypothetical protein
MFQAGEYPQRSKGRYYPTDYDDFYLSGRISDSERGVEQSKTWNNEDVTLNPIFIHIHHP